MERKLGSGHEAHTFFYIPLVWAQVGRQKISGAIFDGNGLNDESPSAPTHRRLLIYYSLMNSSDIWVVVCADDQVGEDSKSQKEVGRFVVPAGVSLS